MKNKKFMLKSQVNRNKAMLTFSADEDILILRDELLDVEEEE